MPPEDEKERRVDAGAILELAAEVRGLAAALEHDRQDRQRERVEDRQALKEWREGQERRLEKLEELAATLGTRVTVLEGRIPDDLDNRVSASDALRRSVRFWLRTVGAGAVTLILGALWALLRKEG